MLEVNASLTRLSLGANNIGDAGAMSIGKALEVNASLTNLSLAVNKINAVGAMGLCKALEVNASLRKLDLFDNNFGGASQWAIRTAWLSNSFRENESGLEFDM